LVGTVVGVEVEPPVLDAPVVVEVVRDMDGPTVAVELPPAGIETPVVIGVASDVLVSVVDGAPVLEGEPELLPLLLPLDVAEEEEEELAPPTGLMAKGFEYWKTVLSESRVMTRPYTFMFPIVLSTAQAYLPAAVSTPSARKGR
jgi:hypothetical protein